jgi:hypothetical protein
MKSSWNEVRVVVGGILLVLSVTASAVRPDHGTSSSAATNLVGDSGSIGGNLAVTVPPTPAPTALRRVCTELIAGRLDRGAGSHDRGTNTIQALIAATGGTTAGALNWCHNYLQLRKTHRSSTK